MLNIGIKVVNAEPEIEKAQINSVYNTVTYSHELGSMQHNMANSNQIDELDTSKHIDPIYAKIKKFSTTHQTHQAMIDNTLNLDVKHKMNSDVM